jgi:hypothetical protein
MIKLTEKQKTVLTQLNDEKGKLEQDYAALQAKISELLEFIFDANGVDTKEIDKIGIQDGHLVYTLKPQTQDAPASEVVAEPVAE